MKIRIKKYFFTLFTLSACIFWEEASALSNSKEDIVTAPNAIYIEIAGRGLFLSASYERLLFETTPHNIALSAGLGFWASIEISGTGPDKSGITIPIYAGYLYGGNHNFELGIGLTLAPGVSYEFAQEFTSDWMITTFIGYRYQPIDGGFLFRVGYAPIFGNEGMIKYGGIALGYAF